MEKVEMLPIILAHGIARFDVLREKIKAELNLPDNPLDDELHYFRNIRAYLVQNGFGAVFSPNVKFAGALERRARQLADFIEGKLQEIGAPRAHIIAHSMGGLDSRYAIVKLGLADRVASLTTIGTPHLGTILADDVVNGGGSHWIDFLQKAIDLDGFNDLTVAACETFNLECEAAEADNSVTYQTYASFEQGTDMFLPLLPSWFHLLNREGSNDGLVPFRSQQWKSFLTGSAGSQKMVIQKEFPIPADHLNQCGWWDWEEAVLPLFGGSFQNQKANYELRIKNIYLEIARDLQNL